MLNGPGYASYCVCANLSPVLRTALSGCGRTISSDKRARAISKPFTARLEYAECSRSRFEMTSITIIADESCTVPSLLGRHRSRCYKSSLEKSAGRLIQGMVRYGSFECGCICPPAMLADRLRA